MSSTTDTNILVTGGAGYIGSHATLALLEAGYDVVVIDNLSNSSPESLRRVEKISSRQLTFIKGDIRDKELLRNVFSQNPISAVLHFAALKAVSESISIPLSYYDNNVVGSQNLLQCMADAEVFKLIFSSSATVYGEPSRVPISEECPVSRPTNPYGRSKLIIEDILHDLSISDVRWKIGILRYFNPVGAHESGLIGENPNGIPNNLLPYISQVAIGKLSKLSVFGGDYPTPDGTGVRDYIHIADLVDGHICALKALASYSGTNIWNLGTGQGFSVLEMINAFELASGKKIPFEIVPRRLGDIAICYADSSKAQRELSWKATRGLDQMMLDAWRWQSNNPNGYANSTSAAA